MLSESIIEAERGRTEPRDGPADFLAGAAEGQRRAVTAAGELITVTAGAGTGKTWVLANRYARLLLTEPDLLPRDILTLTYTEAAASEMRHRIEARVLELMDAMALPPARREAIRNGFGEAWISTIHAFAHRLLRETGLSLDIDPRAVVISPPQEEEFWRGVRDAVEFAGMARLAGPWGEKRLQRAARSLDGDALMGAAAARWGAGALTTLARSAAELHASLGHTWEQMMGWAEDARGEGDPQVLAARDTVAEALRPRWRQVWGLWATVFDGCQAEVQGASAKTDIALADCLGRWFGPGALPPQEADLGEFCLALRDVQGSSGRLFKALKPFLGMTFGDWKKKNEELFTLTASLQGPLPEPERRLRTVLLEFCATAWGLWDTMRRRRGLLTFSDMILHAREALRGDQRPLAFRHILVDEFQDTDPLQFELIEALAGARPEGAPPEGALPSLFAVGDPKQSIYRFRHAEPSLFAGLIVKPGGKKVELDVSFRTRGPLLERVNALFADIWRDGLGSSLPGLAFGPLAPAAGGERDRGTLSPFGLLLAVRDRVEEKTALDEAREHLAQELARRIRGWVEEGRTIWDKKAGGLRPARFADFAILTRQRTVHDLLERALTAEGVPSRQDRSRGYFGRGEVEDVSCLLRAAVDPSDGAAVMGWLLSPFSGVPRQDALRCLEALPQGGSALEALQSLLPEAAGRLQRLTLLGRQKGAGALLSVFDRDRRWLQRYDRAGRLRALRNLRRAIGLAADFRGGLVACADWLARALRQDMALDEPSWHSRKDDVVLITTVHASKGLEYPAVILFDTSSRGRKRGLGVRPSKALGVVFTGFPDEMAAEGGGIRPLGAAWEKLLSAQGELEEDMRLLYVAATRAQDSLWVCGLLDKDEDGLEPQPDTWTARILEHLKAQGRCAEDFTGPDITLSWPGKEPRAPSPRPLPREAKPPVRVPFPSWDGVTLSELSATSFSLFEWCPLAWRRRYRQGLDLRWESPDRDILSLGISPEERGGAELGTLAHWILARWPNTLEGDEGELDFWLTDPAALRRLPSGLRAIWRNPQSREALGKWLSCFAASEAGQRLLRAEGARREPRFRVGLNGVALVGAMDAVWRDGPLWRVLDYKITLAHNAPPGLYEAQLDFYALVIREAALAGKLPCDAVEVELVFLREEGRTERRRWDKGWEALEARAMKAARLGALSSALSPQQPLLTPNLARCGACPWERGCSASSVG